MRILWIINTILPEIAEDSCVESLSDAGWISAALNGMRNYENNDIVVCFCHPGPRLCGKVNGIRYYSFDETDFFKQDKRLEKYLQAIFRKERPDIIHAFGTEYPHTLSVMNVCKENDLLDRTVISIQGLISRCAERYYAGLPTYVIHGFSIRDFLKMDNVYFQKKAFKKRGEYEIEALRIAKNVIGRTEWDFACTKAINPDINYYKCNESLRDCFYQEKWNYETCEKHSIFFSRGCYPLKGMHTAFKVLSEILKKYPDAKIYTTDEDDKDKTFYSRIKHLTFYQMYINRLIKKYHLRYKITFLGELDGPGMRDRYLKSNVFLLCSSIENSSNSLGEAMLLGVPSISSDVGGIKSLINHNSEGFLYPFDEPYMITHYIDKIFSDTNLAKELSKNARAHALITHSREDNHKRLKEIYSVIAGKQEK